VLQSFPLLEDRFRANVAGYRRIVEGDPDGIARSEAELLLERIDAANVNEGNKLATDGAASVDKFTSVVSELHCGLLFSSLGARSDLLLDDAFRPATYTPDLLVRFPDGLQILVEVVRGSCGSPRLAERLAARVAENDLHFGIEFFLGLELSAPASTHAERSADDALCDEVAREIVAGLCTARREGAIHGVLHVFKMTSGLRHELGEDRLALYDDVVTAASGENWLGSFGFDASPTGEGVTGGGATAARIMDDVAYKKSLLAKLRKKAARRPCLPQRHLSMPYVVALQNDEIDLQPLTVLSALTGSRQVLRSPAGMPTEVPPRIAAAARAEWRDLLREWDYIESPLLRLSDYGAFGNEEDIWASNLSGVLVTHNAGTIVQWMPNPFATEAIREPQLLHVGLPLNKLGRATLAMDRS